MRVIIPSERNYEIYHAVETLGMSRREAARRFGISPSRVQQITSDVLRFVMEHGDKRLLNVEPERIELFMLRVCFEQLAFFYHSIVRQYNSPQGQALSPAERLRLVHAAARLSIEQGKLSARIGKARQTMIEAGTDEFERFNYVSSDDVALEDDEAVAADEVNDADEVNETDDAADEATSPPVEGLHSQEADLPDDMQQAISDIITSAVPHASWEEVQAKLAAAGLIEAIEKTPVQLPAGAQQILDMMKENEEEDVVSLMKMQHPK